MLKYIVQINNLLATRPGKFMELVLALEKPEKNMKKLENWEIWNFLFRSHFLAQRFIGFNSDSYKVSDLLMLTLDNF